jgi:hypothetical protein
MNLSSREELGFYITTNPYPKVKLRKSNIRYFSLFLFFVSKSQE